MQTFSGKTAKPGQLLFIAANLVSDLQQDVDSRSDGWVMKGAVSGSTAGSAAGRMAPQHEDGCFDVRKMNATGLFHLQQIEVTEE